jgi:hypothetical protein
MWYYAQNRSLAETDRQMTKHGNKAYGLHSGKLFLIYPLVQRLYLPKDRRMVIEYDGIDVIANFCWEHQETCPVAAGLDSTCDAVPIIEFAMIGRIGIVSVSAMSGCLGRSLGEAGGIFLVPGSYICPYNFVRERNEFCATWSTL